MYIKNKYICIYKEHIYMYNLYVFHAHAHNIYICIMTWIYEHIYKEHVYMYNDLEEEEAYRHRESHMRNTYIKNMYICIMTWRRRRRTDTGRVT